MPAFQTLTPVRLSAPMSASTPDLGALGASVGLIIPCPSPTSIGSALAIVCQFEREAIGYLPRSSSGRAHWETVRQRVDLDDAFDPEADMYLDTKEPRTMPGLLSLGRERRSVTSRRPDRRICN